MWRRGANCAVVRGARRSSIYPRMRRPTGRAVRRAAECCRNLDVWGDRLAPGATQSWISNSLISSGRDIDRGQALQNPVPRAARCA